MIVAVTLRLISETNYLLYIIHLTQQLVDMMSIGTLLAYTIVAICVVVLRYQYDPDFTGKELEMTRSQVIRQLVNANLLKEPTNLSSIIAKMTVVIFCIFSIILCILLTVFDAQSNILLALMAITIIILVLLVLILARQPCGELDLTFKVPMVPVIPCLSIVINLYLMFQLDMHTWIRFVVWIIIGYIIYFTYGIHNAVEGGAGRQQHRQPHQLNGDAPQLAGSMANNLQSLQSINMDFVNRSTLALTDANMKSSKF